MKTIQIAVEGMDGVGKSTIAKMIAEKYKMTYVEKPLTSLFENEILSGEKNLELFSENLYKLKNEVIKGWFFGMGNLLSIIESREKNLNIVLDRHFASNFYFNGTEKSRKIYEIMMELVGKPEITIVLTASVENRLKRICKRNAKDPDLKNKSINVWGYDKMLSFLERYNFKYVVIDTDNKNIEQVFNEVCTILNKLNVNSKKLNYK